MDFDTWLYKVCEHLSKKLKRDIDYIYQHIDLYDAKLQYVNNISPQDFIFNL